MPAKHIIPTYTKHTHRVTVAMAMLAIGNVLLTIFLLTSSATNETPQRYAEVARNEPLEQ